jgi:hypothetical protein
MRPFLRSPFSRGILRLAVMGLIVAVSAMGIHALIHYGGNADNGQQCQVCHISNAASPIPAIQVHLQTPIVFSRYSAAPVKFSNIEPICEHCCPRAPPASLFS